MLEKANLFYVVMKATQGVALKRSTFFNLSSKVASVPPHNASFPRLSQNRDDTSDWYHKHILCFFYLMWILGIWPKSSLPLMCGNQGSVFAFQVKDLPIFLRDFRDVLRLAVLSCFTAQLVEWRKTVSSAIVFGIFSLLCSSLKLSSSGKQNLSFHFRPWSNSHKNQYWKSFGDFGQAPVCIL